MSTLSAAIIFLLGAGVSTALAVVYNVRRDRRVKEEHREKWFANNDIEMAEDRAFDFDVLRQQHEAKGKNADARVCFNHHLEQIHKYVTAKQRLEELNK